MVGCLGEPSENIEDFLLGIINSWAKAKKVPKFLLKNKKGLISLTVKVRNEQKKEAAIPCTSWNDKEDTKAFSIVYSY